MILTNYHHALLDQVRAARRTYDADIQGAIAAYDGFAEAARRELAGPVLEAREARIPKYRIREALGNSNWENLEKLLGEGK